MAGQPRIERDSTSFPVEKYLEKFRKGLGRGVEAQPLQTRCDSCVLRRRRPAGPAASCRGLSEMAHSDPMSDIASECRAGGGTKFLPPLTGSFRMTVWTSAGANPKSLSDWSRPEHGLVGRGAHRTRCMSCGRQDLQLRNKPSNGMDWQ